VKDDALSLVAAYCATKIPSEHDDKIRIEYKVHGNKITIYECRPPWREDFGPEWTSMRICSMQWDSVTGLWALYARDRHGRRLDYPYVDPAPSVKSLLVELDDDPTSIFWG
jgi:hypothetical protein